jgi:hypothetical protein
MATDVSICSNALLLVGAQTINDFSGEDDRTKLVSNLWPMVRDWLLRSHNWNCATKRVQLAPDPTAPEFDYAFRFLIPSDWLRTLQVGERGSPLDYTHEGRYILCDTNPLPFVYIARVNEGAWDTLLQIAATSAMAALIAYPIAKSTALAESNFAKMVTALKQARAVDGQDTPGETLGDFRLFNSRFSSGLPTARW